MKSFADLQNAKEKGANPAERLARATMWPPGEASPPVPIERCLRVVPQDADTGGFFVALIKKLKPLPSEKESTRAAASLGPPLESCHRRGNGMFQRISPRVGKSLESALGLPPASLDLILGRSKEPKRLWVFTQAAHTLALDPRIQSLNGGLEVLRLSSGGAAGLGWQLCQEGVLAMAPLLPRERVIDLPEGCSLKAGRQSLRELGINVGRVTGPVVLRLPAGGGDIAAQVLPSGEGVYLSASAAERAALLAPAHQPAWY